MRLFLMLLLLVPGLAAGQATHGFDFTWVDPVDRTDGEALDPNEELALYQLHCVRTDGAEEASIEVLRGDTEAVDGNTRGYFWEGAVERGGWYDCRVFVTDTEGLSSDWSDAASVRKRAQPTPPGQLRERR